MPVRHVTILISGAVVEGLPFDRWAVILSKPDAVQRGLVDAVLARIESAGVSVRARTDLVVEPWQAHVAYRDMLADPGRHPVDCPHASTRPSPGSGSRSPSPTGGPTFTPNCGA